MLAGARRFVLTFHGLGEIERELDPGELDVWLTREEYVATLDALAGQDGVELTFDDGNASDYHIGFPALAERSLSATFFVVADRIGRPGYLSSEQLREMAAAGMSIGSHGMHHVAWRGLPDSALSAELVQAKDVISDACGRSVTAAACPFGAYDRRVVSSARRAGFERLYTSDRGPARAGAFIQPRCSLQRGDPVEELRSLLGEGIGTQATREMKKLVKRWR